MKRSLALSSIACIAIAGAVAAAPASAAGVTAKTVPFWRPLQLHSKGKDVYRLQVALTRAHVRPQFRKPTGQFGLVTRYEVRRWQRNHHISATGVVGRPTKATLWRFYTPYGRYVETRAAAWHRHMLAVLAARRAAEARARASFTGRVLEATAQARSHAYLMGYSQSWSRTYLPAYPSVPRATDCSGYAIWVLRHAGVNLPMGWTGTLGVEGWRVFNPSPATMRVGDLVFNSGYPYSHVSVYIGRGLVSSHGSAGIAIRAWNADRRGVGAVRRYHN